MFLSLLGEGNLFVEIFQDGLNAHRYASDYKTENRRVKQSHNLKLELSQGGGWAAIFSPENK